MKKTILVFFFTISLISLFSEPILRTVSVVGKGSMTIKPDRVVITTGVDSSNKIIGLALNENGEIMTKIFEGLADLGIEDKDIQTSNYNVYYYKPYKDEIDQESEYRVSNSITISIKNLDLIDTVLDTVVTLGANKINGIFFTFEDETVYKQELQKLAMENARERAEFLADIEDMKILNVLSISDIQANSRPDPRNYEYALASSAGNRSIATGSETLSMEFNVIYQICSK
ncbi:MAG: hypothetical protein B6229_00765 [Spirochaetaceae bacterium 4572_7]|nr:MAG: hypothetical protein B6229_00765 [Spirochaetaceae bacterium 4572_7]